MQGTFTDEASVVERIGSELEKRIGSQKYRIWFRNSTKLRLNEGFLTVGVANLFIANWIESHFLEEIRDAAGSVLGENPRITVNIDLELSSCKQNRRYYAKNRASGRTEKETPARKSGRKGGSRRELKLGLETFVVGPSNELAYNAAKAVTTDKKSPFNPLFIHGGYGVGKTHLLQGICNAVCRHRPQAGWLYLSAEDFANQFVLALKTKKLEAFRRRMRRTELLAIDDIHFLASKPSTQQEFLHTFNTIDLAGKQVILASDAHPKMIDQLSEKLVNRFVSGMVVKVDSPNYETRCKICRQYAQKHSTKFPESVVEYVARHLRTNVRELEGALLKLIAFSSLQSRKITLTMAKEVLIEHLARTDPIVHVSDIESAAAGYFGTTTAHIHSARKSKTVSLARHFSMYLVRKHTHMSSAEIGRLMGNKNHATVLNACKKVEARIKSNAQINWEGSGGNRVRNARKVVQELEESICR